MILKVKRTDGGWDFYEAFKRVSVFEEIQNGKSRTVVDLNGSPIDAYLVVDTEAYLMNDNGKTLQVVHG
jgi:hypothetical protein